MCVQSDGVKRKAIQDIVLYCLTPPRFRRYSSFNLCRPFPAWGEEMIQPINTGSRVRSSGNLCSKQACEGSNFGLSSDWPLSPRSRRCSN
jgi:hypothetical protein